MARRAVLCGPNQCLCLAKTDATELRISPESPRVPRSHTLELHCESRCDSHLRHSLKLTWRKGGEAFGGNGTDDGRWVSARGESSAGRNVGRSLPSLGGTEEAPRRRATLLPGAPLLVL